jgi:hypothetical protein
MSTTLETEFNDLTGTMDVSLVEETPFPRQTNIIYTSETWHAELTWDVSGGLVTSPIDAEWRFALYLEGIGPSPDMQIPLPPPPDKFQTTAFIQGQTHYDEKITVNPHEVPQGSYKPTVVLYLYNPNNNKPFGVGGFIELGMLLLHDPK